MYERSMSSTPLLGYWHCACNWSDSKGPVKISFLTWRNCVRLEVGLLVARRNGSFRSDGARLRVNDLPRIIFLFTTTTRRKRHPRRSSRCSTSDCRSNTPGKDAWATRHCRGRTARRRRGFQMRNPFQLEERLNGEKWRKSASQPTLDNLGF